MVFIQYTIFIKTIILPKMLMTIIVPKLINGKKIMEKIQKS